MATLFTPTTEFVDVVDGLEAVTVAFPGASSSTSVAHAKRQSITIRDAGGGDGLYASVGMSGGRYLSSDVNWHLPISEMATRPPLGTRVIDSSSVYWTVLNVAKNTRDTRWKCLSRALEIVAGLDTTIRIQAAQASKGKAGEFKPLFFDVIGGLKAKIQEVATTNTKELGLKFTKREFRITVAEQVTVDQTMRVIGPDGTSYQIHGIEHLGRLDALPVILASTDPFPEV